MNESHNIKNEGNTVSRTVGKYNQTTFPEFAKLCWMIKAKIMMLINVAPNVYRENI